MLHAMLQRWQSKQEKTSWVYSHMGEGQTLVPQEKDVELDILEERLGLSQTLSELL